MRISHMRICGSAVLGATLLLGATAPQPVEGAAVSRVVTPSARARASLRASALAVWRGGRWVTWWRSDRAPARWDTGSLLESDVEWRRVAPGVEWGELRLSGDGEAWRLRVIVARVDPRQALISVAAGVKRTGASVRPAWTIDSAPHDAALALNAGQFRGAAPWGWLVHRGHEYRAPGIGSVAPAVVVDTAGRVSIVPVRSIDALRRDGRVSEAFQSYPALLEDGAIPFPLLERGRGVDLQHRDARLAIGTLRDGRVLVALTRFDGLGGVLQVVPFGPTVPEMAALLGALGARDAVLLDGGISGQLLVRDSTGTSHRWPGIRRVPLGLVVVPRG